MIDRATRLAGTNIEHAGRHNLRVVLQVIRADGPITRSRIAARTGLTTATVTNITNRLLDEGLLASVGQLRGGRGQPALQLEVRAEGAFALGLNIDRDHLTMVAVDFAGAVRARISEPFIHPGPDQVRDFVSRHLETLLTQGQIERAAIVGMGLAVPDDLGILALPGYPADHDNWSSVDVEDLLAPLVDVPVLIENDAAAAAMGEMQFGLGQDLTRFFHLLLTFALGGGVVTNALYDRGAQGAAARSALCWSMTGRAAAPRFIRLYPWRGFLPPWWPMGMAKRRSARWTIPLWPGRWTAGSRARPRRWSSR